MPMNLTTPVSILPPERLIRHTHKILLLGSCFADEIGAWLDFHRFRVLINPFGTLYNPVSIARSVERLASAQEFTSDELVENQGIYSTFYHHSDYADTDPVRFLARANAALHEGARFLHEADTVIITLGTARVYRHIGRDIIVSNCRKMPARLFRQELLEVSDVLRCLREITGRFPGKQFILTVSPIRHLKDGAHGNRISKAVLLLAAEQLLAEAARAHSASPRPCIYYFPAYEIMMDELRDYRFYAEDMVHPSAQAVRYIFDRFRDACIAPEDHPLMQRIARMEKGLRHTPLFPDSAALLAFREKLNREREELEREYPYLARR